MLQEGKRSPRLPTNVWDTSSSQTMGWLYCHHTDRPWVGFTAIIQTDHGLALLPSYRQTMGWLCCHLSFSLSRSSTNASEEHDPIMGMLCYTPSSIELTVSKSVIPLCPHEHSHSLPYLTCIYYAVNIYTTVIAINKGREFT